MVEANHIQYQSQLIYQNIGIKPIVKGTNIMLELTTSCGNFKHFKDIYLYMLEEDLKDIEITEIKYCLDKIYGSGIYTLEQIRDILEV